MAGIDCEGHGLGKGFGRRKICKREKKVREIKKRGIDGEKERGKRSKREDEKKKIRVCVCFIFLILLDNWGTKFERLIKMRRERNKKRRFKNLFGIIKDGHLQCRFYTDIV